MKATYIYFLFLFFISMSCEGQKQSTMLKDIFKPNNEKTLAYIEKENLDKKYSTAYFASGCFWCVEPIFESIDGVKEVISGYAGGHADFVNYELLSTGTTGHAETVKIYYDQSVVSFQKLVQVYFASHDYTQVDGQGPDRGPQYRSVAFYQNEQEKEILMEEIQKIEHETSELVATQVVPYERFFVAEDKHQNFKARNKNHPYILNVSNPRFNKFKDKMTTLKKKVED